MIKKLKSRAGLTLTEMLVTMLILTMFSTACLIGVTTAFRARQDNIKANFADVLSSTVTQLITDELRMSEFETTPTDGPEITYVSHASNYGKARMYLNADGYLYMDVGSADAGKSQPMLSSAMYMDTTQSDPRFKLKLDELYFSVDATNGNITVTFKVLDDNGAVLADKTGDNGFTVKPLNGIS